MDFLWTGAYPDKRQPSKDRLRHQPKLDSIQVGRSACVQSQASMVCVCGLARVRKFDV